MGSLSKRYIFLVWCILNSLNIYGADHLLTFFLKSSEHDTTFVTYAGYLDSSDNNGQIIFPRLTGNASFTLIITPLIQPVFMIGNTIHHWRIIDGLSYQAFSIERLKDNNIFYWEIKDQQHIKDGIIPINAIVILGTPEDFKVTVGKTKTHDSPHFILPSIKVQRLNTTPAIIDIKEFFGTLSTLPKEQKEAYISTLVVP